MLLERPLFELYDEDRVYFWRKAGKALKSPGKPKKYRKFGRKPKNAILESWKVEKKSAESWKKHIFSAESRKQTPYSWLSMMFGD